MRRGWNGVRREWLRCAWIGCSDELVSRFGNLCPSHVREDDRRFEAFKRAQLEFEFEYRPVVVVKLPEVPLWDTQLNFAFPLPRLRGSRRPIPSKDQLRKKTVRELEVAAWNVRKERLITKRKMKEVMDANRAQNKQRWKEIYAEVEKEGA